MDDRTPAERGEASDVTPDPELVGGGVRRLPKSRYSVLSECCVQALLLLVFRMAASPQVCVSSLVQRYSSMSRYIGQPQSPSDVIRLHRLNDLDNSVDEQTYQLLLDGGVDPVLSAHLAHMFTRDPLVIFDDTVPPAADAEAIQPGLDHFESIQSTNWRSVRWKPPVSPPPISSSPKKSAATQRRASGPGWRVEFRPLEVRRASCVPCRPTV